MQARVVVGLREVDPLDRRAGIGLPRLEEAAEQNVVQVLVVEAHEGEFDALELAGLHVGLGRPQAHLADLLEVGVGRGPFADAGDLQDFDAQALVLRESLGRFAEHAAGAQRGHRRRALENRPAVERGPVTGKRRVR